MHWNWNYILEIFIPQSNSYDRETNSTILNSEINNKEELNLYLWSPIETKCEQYLIFWLLLSENVKLPITLLSLYPFFVSLIRTRLWYQVGPSLQRKMTFVTFYTCTLIQTSKNRRFLDQDVCLDWILRNLERLLIPGRRHWFP